MNTAHSNSDCLALPLGLNHTTLISEDDRDLASFKWRPYKRRNSERIEYAVRRGQTHDYLHRIILERMLGRKLVKGEMVDHINGDGLDNRRNNLRLANSSQNNYNSIKSKRNTTGYKGVSWCKGKQKWTARIRVNKRSIFLGYFNSPVDAHEAYCAAAKHYAGEFFNPG